MSAYRISADPQMIIRLEREIGSAATLSAAIEALALCVGLSRTTLASLERGGGSIAKLM